jgi:Glyoxalase-like domain
MPLRLRQLCLVAHHLEPVVEDLRTIFDVEVCHRDPLVEHFGLHNAVLPFGTSFVEVVAPLTEGTTAGRYLDRRGGDGGYMVIFNGDDLGAWRTHLAEIGVRIAAPLAHGDYEGLQLHPRDTGGALLEINKTLGGEDLQGPYAPAGPDWQHAIRTTRVKRIAGAVLQADDPERLARRWGEVLAQPASRAGNGRWQVEVGNAVLRFVEARDGRGEGLAGIDLEVTDPQSITAAATACGCAWDGDAVMVGGVRFSLQTSR